MAAISWKISCVEKLVTARTKIHHPPRLKFGPLHKVQREKMMGAARTPLSRCAARAPAFALRRARSRSCAAPTALPLSRCAARAPALALRRAHSRSRAAPRALPLARTREGALPLARTREGGNFNKTSLLHMATNSSTEIKAGCPS